MDTENAISTIELATEMTIAWLANPNTRAGAEDASSFLIGMKGALDRQLAPEAGIESESEADRPQAAVSVRKSLASRDHIISLIDGKPYRTLRRHLSTHGMTPDQYRARYGLKSDYPMVAETYSEQRRAMAHKIGLGRKPAAAPAVEAAEAPAPAKSRRSRKAPAA